MADFIWARDGLVFQSGLPGDLLDGVGLGTGGGRDLGCVEGCWGLDA